MGRSVRMGRREARLPAQGQMDPVVHCHVRDPQTLLARELESRSTGPWVSVARLAAAQKIKRRP